eukprot:m.131407 g.131407  ORF g.131407 m.131407 type:complete len:165 (-) comp29544_c1_seq2:968-1462(-)
MRQRHTVAWHLVRKSFNFKQRKQSATTMCLKIMQSGCGTEKKEKIDIFFIEALRFRVLLCNIENLFSYLSFHFGFAENSKHFCEIMEAGNRIRVRGMQDLAPDLPCFVVLYQCLLWALCHSVVVPQIVQHGCFHSLLVWVCFDLCQRIQKHIFSFINVAQITEH